MDLMTGLRIQKALSCTWKLGKALTPQIHNQLLLSPNPVLIQPKREFVVLPFGLDFALLGTCAYHLAKLKSPSPKNVLSIFGPAPGSKESELYPDRVPTCIAQRGAGLDAPENTIEAFRNCLEQDCNFLEFDVRSSKDGKIVLLNDLGLERLAGSEISNVHIMDWEHIKDINIAAKHPKRQQFKEVKLCLLEDALNFLLQYKAKMIIDVRGEDKALINGILQTFKERPELHEHAAIASLNPYVLYMIRMKDPEIVGALNYRPYAFSHLDYESEFGPCQPRSQHLVSYSGLRCLDVAYDRLWRWAAHLCGASAVLLHKDVVSKREVRYWHNLNMRCIGWSVNMPIEKLYWSGVLKSPYLANTLLGEPSYEEKKVLELENLPPVRKTILE